MSLVSKQAKEQGVARGYARHHRDGEGVRQEGGDAVRVGAPWVGPVFLCFEPCFNTDDKPGKQADACDLLAGWVACANRRGRAFMPTGLYLSIKACYPSM